MRSIEYPRVFILPIFLDQQFGQIAKKPDIRYRPHDKRIFLHLAFDGLKERVIIYHMLYDIIANNQIEITIRKLFINFFVGSCKNLEQLVGCNPGCSLKWFNTPVFTLPVEMGGEIALTAPYFQDFGVFTGYEFHYFRSDAFMIQRAARHLYNLPDNG